MTDSPRGGQTSEALLISSVAKTALRQAWGPAALSVTPMNKHCTISDGTAQQCHLGFGRTVASETETPTMLANLV